MSSKKNKLITAAIDFGTTFSGYAYGMKTDLEKEPPSIMTNSWPAGRTLSYKAPTSVLFNEKKEMDSFGYKAEEKYANICATGKHKSWYFFQRFKMLLYESKDLSMSTLLKEEAGKTMVAIDVFAAAINFLKQDLLNVLHNSLSGIADDDIHWILTMPAIWLDKAKLFMRRAAVKAGIMDNQLTIALESECASVYCQRVPTEKKKCSDGSTLSITEPNSEFIVLDLGGATVDISVHERQQDGRLMELHPQSGGPWGGTNVDEQFSSLLDRVFGGDDIAYSVISTFKEKDMEDYIDFCREFEVKKRQVSFDADTLTTITLPCTLMDVFQEKTGKTIKDVASGTRFGNKIRVKGNKMRLESEVMESLYLPALDSIVNHLKELFKSCVVSRTKTIIMVGGLSTSGLVQTKIRDTFPTKKVYVPGEPDMAVLMGAVLFGHNPDVISSRVSRFTYGFSAKQKFIGGFHSEGKREVIDGEAWCDGVFSKLIEMNQPLKMGVSIVKEGFCPTSWKDKWVAIDIYAVIQKNPIYVTDPGCQYLGKIIVFSHNLRVRGTYKRVHKPRVFRTFVSMRVDIGTGLRCKQIIVKEGGQFQTKNREAP